VLSQLFRRHREEDQGFRLARGKKHETLWRQENREENGQEGVETN
jgi:hypothetical protein